MADTVPADGTLADGETAGIADCLLGVAASVGDGLVACVAETRAGCLDGLLAVGCNGMLDGADTGRFGTGAEI